MSLGATTESVKNINHKANPAESNIKIDFHSSLVLSVHEHSLEISKAESDGTPSHASEYFTKRE
jgi:hypothetical protein